MWRQLEEQLRLLSELAIACFCLVPTSCSVERQIKQNSFIHTTERNCLAIESLSAQLLVRHATVNGYFQPWRQPDVKRKRKRLTAEEKNAKAARAEGGDASAPAESSGAEQESLAEVAEPAGVEEADAEDDLLEKEAAEAVADWQEQEGREALRDLIADVPGAPIETPLIVSAPRDPVRHSARSNAGKDSRTRFE
jgi:hypothetical protein